MGLNEKNQVSQNVWRGELRNLQWRKEISEE